MLHNVRDKNDSKDAQVILHMQKVGATQRYVGPLAAGVNGLQDMSITHKPFPRQNPDLTSDPHACLSLNSPEIERFVGNSRSDRFLALFERFSTPGSITDARRLPSRPRR